MNLHLKALVVIRTAFADKYICQVLVGILLDNLLQRGFIVIELGRFIDRLFEKTQNEPARLLKSSVKINGRNNSLKRIGKN